jgi:hypothetical protein
MAHDGTGAGWDITAPADIDAVALGAQEIRDLRRGIATRINREHVTLAEASAGGWHKAGSAKAYYQSAAPTQRPDAATALSADDNGRLFVDSDDQKMYVYVHGTGFVQVKGFIDTDDIVTSMIEDGAVTNPKMAADSVDTVNLVDDAVTTGKILDDAVVTDKIPDGAVTLAKLASVIPLRGSIAIYEDRKSSGSGGGNSTSGSWIKRDLNTEVFDEGSIGALASDQVTLGAGTYKIEAMSIFRETELSQIRIRDVTNSTTLVLGMSHRVGGSANTAIACHAFGVFTLSGTAALELQYHVGNTKTDGLGLGVNTGELEVFSRVVITKLT